MALYFFYLSFENGLFGIIGRLLVAEMIELGIPMLLIKLGVAIGRAIGLFAPDMVLSFSQLFDYSVLGAIALEATFFISIILMKVRFIRGGFMQAVIEWTEEC